MQVNLISWAGLPKRLALASIIMALSWFSGLAQAQTPPNNLYVYGCAEGTRCYIGPYFKDVIFGVSGRNFYKRAAVSDVIDCNQDNFGGDPVRKTAKHCFISVAESKRVGCAIEGQTCVLNGTQNVMYGVAGRYVFAEKSGSFNCSKGSFGGKDPYPDRQKACFIGAPQ